MFKEEKSDFNDLSVIMQFVKVSKCWKVNLLFFKSVFENCVSDETYLLCTHDFKLQLIPRYMILSTLLYFI